MLHYSRSSYNQVLQKALEHTLSEREIHKYSFYVKLICQYPFSSDICIAFYWNKMDFNWERITLPIEDNRNVLNTLTNKKENKEIDLLLNRQTGQNEIQLLQPLFSQLQKLSIPIDLQLNRQVGRDGHTFIFTLGNEYSYTTYYWSECASISVWQDLTECANTILSIANELIATKTETINYSYIYELDHKKETVFYHSSKS
ncbi:hypothetical protein V9L05_10645 [Bernardetia sp. Wsw4-3y2]|uniref:hypothetical protein n=1 Tax=Bernardetia sp. Wsw4-3y2 TaxID=3127471 RepID=UPI0030D39493